MELPGPEKRRYYVKQLYVIIINDVMNRKVWSTGILLLLLLLVACGPPLENSTGSRPGIEVDTIIIYEREGGFAGIGQEWVIHLDGSIEGPGDQQLAVPPEEVQDLVEIGVESDIESLVPDLATPDPCCDQFTYTLTVISGDEEWSLVTTDSAEQPDEITELFIMVEALIADAEPVP